MNQAGAPPGGGGGFRGPNAPIAAIEYSCAGQSSSFFPFFPRRDPARGTAADSSRCTPDCASSNEIKAREPIRCRECGCRVMYKKRVKRSKPTTQHPTSLRNADQPFSPSFRVISFPCRPFPVVRLFFSLLPLRARTDADTLSRSNSKHDNHSHTPPLLLIDSHQSGILEFGSAAVRGSRRGQETERKSSTAVNQWGNGVDSTIACNTYRRSSILIPESASFFTPLTRQSFPAFSTSPYTRPQRFSLP